MTHYRYAAAPVLLACSIPLALVASRAPRAPGDRQATAAAESGRFPRFDRVVLLEKTSETSANASMGDLDGDGDLDIVLAKGRHWPLANRVLLNDGRAGFDARYDLGGPADRTYSALLADLDGDRDLDVVISNDAKDPKVVHLNDGKGRFHAASTFGRPEWPTRNASVADLDGSGLPDIIVANRFGDREGANYVCLNRGDGRFDADCIPFSRESATTVTPVDFNRDGFIDLAVPHRDGGQSHIYLNDGKAGFAKRVPFGPADASIRVSAPADVNGDGRIDLVTIDERRGVSILVHQQGGAFIEGASLGSRSVVPYALAVEDLNGDGHIDVIVGNVEAPSVVYFNNGSGKSYTPVGFGDGQGTAYGFAVGDVDKDGTLDIAVARSDAPNVLYFGTPAPRRQP